MTNTQKQSEHNQNDERFDFVHHTQNCPASVYRVGVNEHDQNDERFDFVSELSSISL